MVIRTTVSIRFKDWKGVGRHEGKQKSTFLGQSNLQCLRTVYLVL